MIVVLACPMMPVVFVSENISSFIKAVRQTLERSKWMTQDVINFCLIAVMPLVSPEEQIQLLLDQEG